MSEPLRHVRDAAALLSAARAARERAYAPFSRFGVGAAIETIDGQIVVGCNVESATYGLTLCAERVTIFRAVAEGHREFSGIAIVADATAPTPPCGSCRQVLWELAGDLEVLLGDLTRQTGRLRLATLLPMPFDGRQLRRPRDPA